MHREQILRLPYLHDHHSHVSLYAALEGIPDLTGLDREKALGLLRALPADRLSLVKGWRTDRLPLSAPGLSDDLAKLPPAIIVNASLHGYLITKLGLPFVEELWPELAEHAEDSAWGERALPRLFSFYGRVAGLDSDKLATFMGRMQALGLGSLEDMTLAGEEALSIESASPFASRILSWATPDVFLGLSAARRASCVGIKIFLDGSLGAKSAALDAPFSDGQTGGLLYGDGELTALIAEIASYGAALSIHAIGHLAIEQALRCLERASAGGGLPSVRIEHSQFISLRQARRCKDAGVILSMQPNFNSDSRDYADRLDPRHLAQNDPFRMLIDDAGFVPGRDLRFGSDGMAYGPEEALRWSLFPDFEGQRLSLEEFEAGYGRARGMEGPDEGEGSVFAIDTLARRLRRIS